MTRFVQTVAVALSLLWSVGVVSAATYTFTPLNYPGSRQTVAYGVNDAGHIVGIYSLPDESVERGFYFDGSSYITLTLGACAQLQAHDINNQNEIVGACQNTSGNHGVYMDLHGFQQIIDAPGGAHGTSLLAVNTEGFLAGIYWDATDRIHGLLTDLDTWTTIDVPGNDTTLVLQRDFSQLTALGEPSLPMGDIRRMVATLPVAHEVQHLLGVKHPLGQNRDQQHLHLGQGQARRFFLI